jgi:hypothetical protein
VPAAAGATPAVAYEQLKAGHAWPSDVQPDRRECYLAAAEFQEVFDMSYATFLELPDWKQLQLKKKYDLF